MIDYQNLLKKNHIVFPNILRNIRGIIFRKCGISLNPYPYRKYTNRYKCIFIHIPKTAGTSILSILGEGTINRDHAIYNIYRKADKQKFNKYYKFTFVRNPWDRVVSTYEYLIQGGNKFEDKYFEELLKSKYDTFEKFVMEYLNKDIIHEHDIFRPQYLYIYDHKGICQVDFIGKYEELNQSFKVISEKLKIPSDLPRVNLSRRVEYSTYFKKKEIIDKISDLYNRDIQLFDYKFHENN